MRRILSLAALALLECRFGAPPQAAAAPPADAATEARVRRVVTGLAPAVRIEGQPVPRMNLWDRMARRKTPGVSIAVIDGGAIAWARGFGLLEAGGTDSVTTMVLFQAGSVSKPVAAMAALALVEADRLRLDGEVNPSLRTWRIPSSDSIQGEPVSLRRLLTHSAGLTVHGFPGYARSDSIPTLVQVLDGVRPSNTLPIRVDLRPGRRFRYSGGGYCVAQQLLIDVERKPFAEIVRERVLRPLGMDHSTFDQVSEPVSGVLRASGHGLDGSGVPGRWHRYPELAAAGLWTTPTDLARLVLEVGASFRGASSRVLSGATTRAMLEPQITRTQGIGWRVAGTGGSARFEHAGDTEGYSCAVIGYPERGQGAVVMTNGSGGGLLIQEILRGIALEYGWPGYLPEPRRVVSMSRDALSAFVGNYALEIAPNILVDISAKDDSLFLTVTQPSGTQRSLLYAEEANRFFDRDSGLQITFTPAADGRTRTLVIHQGEDEFRASRVP